MIAALSEHRDEVVALCRRFGVRRLDVFGSATGEEFDPASSDIDLLVELEPLEGMSRFDAFFGMKEGLEALFGRPVDLVEERLDFAGVGSAPHRQSRTAAPRLT
ncbi:MAG: nucleotidyltransferase domain-containing protein [Actinobacteria bacterium]|nr:nucleotidyltransferase domain-containing protein [Actinomycetota bacterium]